MINNTLLYINFKLRAITHEWSNPWSFEGFAYVHNANGMLRVGARFFIWQA